MLKNRFRPTFLFSLLLLLCAPSVNAQQTPAATSSPSASPSPTPVVFSAQTLADLKRLQQAALTSDYAFRQGAHLFDKIGARQAGSAQGAQAGEDGGIQVKAT